MLQRVLLNKTAYYGLPILMIAVLASIIYFQGIPYDYVLDDKIVFTENNFVKEGISGVPDILGSDSFVGYFGEKKELLSGARYRPLSLVTFALEYQFFGQNSQVSHGVNLILYILCCLLLFFTIKRMLTKKNNKEWAYFLALMCALIYTVHPVHVEAVANVKGRDEIMVLLFSLATTKLIFDFTYRPKWLTAVLSALLFFFALLSKENALTFLVIIPAALFFFKKMTKRKWLTVMGILAIPTLIYFVVRISAVGGLFQAVNSKLLMNNPFLEMNVLEKYATVFHTLFLYLKLSFFPHPLTHDYYPYHITIKSWSDWTPWLSLILHATLAAIIIWFRKKNKVISFSTIFYFSSLSIVSNLFINVGTFMNERFLFIPTVGVCLFMAYLFVNTYFEKDKKFKIAAAFMAVILIAGYTFKSYSRVPDWKNRWTLNHSAVSVSQNSARANLFLGVTYFEEMKTQSDLSRKKQFLDNAEKYINRAVEISPTYGNALQMKTGVAGERYGINGDINELLSIFTDVASIRPDIDFLHTYLKYLNDRYQHIDELMNFYYNVGYNILHKEKGNNQWALSFLSYAVTLKEYDARINMAISEVYAAMNDRTNADFYRQKAATN